jgi:hypothetical protein
LADGFISAEPDEIVYVVPSITTVPLMESVSPAVSLPVTVKVIVPEAVPFSLESPTTLY